MLDTKMCSFLIFSILSLPSALWASNHPPKVEVFKRVFKAYRYDREHVEVNLGKDDWRIVPKDQVHLKRHWGQSPHVSRSMVGLGIVGIVGFANEVLISLLADPTPLKRALGGNRRCQCVIPLLYAPTLLATYHWFDDKLLDPPMSATFKDKVSKQGH